MKQQGTHDVSTLDLHYKFAVKVGPSWVSMDENGKYYLSAKEAAAETRWDIRGAQGIGERYMKANWNVTMGDKPVMVLEKIHRPQRIHHWW
jgi:hypothetical protein